VLDGEAFREALHQQCNCGLGGLSVSLAHCHPHRGSMSSKLSPSGPSADLMLLNQMLNMSPHCISLYCQSSIKRNFSSRGLRRRLAPIS
jgi:hypothetical protein